MSSIFSSFGQLDYAKQWQLVDGLEKKGLYREALAKVDDIIENALNDKASEQVIKANFFQLKYNQYITEDDYVVGIHRIEKLIHESDITTASILHSVLAEVYYGYYARNTWKFRDRTAVATDIKLDDIRTWDLERLAHKTIEHYLASFESKTALKEQSITVFPELIEQVTDFTKNWSLYEFLANRAFDFFSANSFNIEGPAETFTINSRVYYNTNQAFKSVSIASIDTFNLKFYAVKVLQELTAYHLDNNDFEALFQIQLKRLKWVHDHCTLSNKEELFEQAIKNLTVAYKDYPAVGEAWYELANFYVLQTNGQDVKTATQIEKDRRIQAAMICKQVIESLPKTYGAEQCEALLSQLKAKDLSLICESVYLPMQRDKFLISYKNLKSVYVKIVQYKNDDNLNTEELKAYANKQAAVYETIVSLTGSEDLFGHSIEAMIPELPIGYYLLVTSTNKNFEKENIGIAFSKFWVSQLTYQLKTTKEGADVMVMCRKTGHPLEGAEVKISQQAYNRVLRKYQEQTIATQKTNKMGVAHIDKIKQYQSYFVAIKSGEDRFEPKQSFYFNEHGPKNHSQTQIRLFTDRKLYRPGQTIYFKGIVTSFDGKTNRLERAYSTTVTFLDVNYQEIKRITVITNEFGSFEGKFLAPYGVLTGRMIIKTPFGTTNVQVEAYKRPKFSATIRPLVGEYKLNDEVNVKGFAEAFAGSKISDAIVKYRIQRTTQFNHWRWWYRPSPPKEVANGETTTNEKGEFNFSFTAIPDESINPITKPIFNYTISVDVIDINGETHTAIKTFNLGYHSLVLSNNIAERIDANTNAKFEIDANSLNGEKLNVSGSFEIYKLISPENTVRKRLWSDPDQLQWTESEFKQLFPGDVFKNEANFHNWKIGQTVQSGVFNTQTRAEVNLKDLNKWPVGRYKYVASTKDKNGVEVEDEHYFTVFNPKSKKPIDKEIFTAHPISRAIQPGKSVKILLSTAEEHLNVFYSISFKGETLNEEWIHLKNEQTAIDFEVTELHIGDLLFEFLVVKNDRVYSQSIPINVVAPKHHLNITLESFRDKMLPGQDEEWSIVIKNASNKAVQAELLATLYDASLDELFTKNNFSFSLPSPYYRNNAWGHPAGFDQAAGSNVNYYWNSYASMPHRFMPQLNTFGYNARRYGGLYRELGAYSRIADVEEYDDGAPMMDAVEEVKISKSSAKQGTPAPAMAGEKYGNEEPPDTPLVSENNSNVLTPQPRSNFNETAFFYPQIHTNEKGEIRLKFTMPESLTKWRFLGLAHSQTLEIGQIEKELVTQKDLMVLPNMPRFFRETDQITVSTKITNIASEHISGTVSIRFFDPITEKDITNQFIQIDAEKSFSVSAEGNTQVSWTVNVPEDWSAVTYQIMANSPHHSDGEENVLPILSNRMLVTESMPMPINTTGTKTFTFKKLKAHNSATLKHHQLTLEFTSNPAWYALQAMPYMMEYPYECAEQTFTRYYSNAIATHVLNSKPKIKAIIEKWRKDSPEAFLSKLNKNQELKSLLLEETPWVLNANSETETKRNLAVLLNLKRMEGELQKALSKTIKAQSNSGAWAWFPGMKDNRYITQHIVTGLGHLDVLGISDIKVDPKVRRMVEKAVNYLDQEIVKDLERLKKFHSETYLKNNHLGYIQIQYLYMRSYFPGIKMTKATMEAIEYYSAQAENYWLTYNIYAKGMIGLAAKRMQMTQLSTDIYKSLKDNAIFSEAFGMYWKSYTTGYNWYQAPIESQALMIEFFNEMGDLQSVEQLKMWLLKEKQTTHWKTTKQTAEAVYALLLNGIDLLETDQLVKITVGGKQIEYVKELSSNPYQVKAEAGTGYFKTKWNSADINRDMATVTVNKSTQGPSWGALYWQYFEQLDKITFAKTPLQLVKTVYKVVLTNSGEKLESISAQQPINVGDKIRVRIELRTDRNLEYVHLKDMRAAGFEPINQMSSYKYQGGLGYYEAIKDAATNFFFDYIPKGTYVFEYDLRAEQLGDFSNGIATIQCMYAPEFTAHSNGIRLKIEPKK